MTGKKEKRSFGDQKSDLKSAATGIQDLQREIDRIIEENNKLMIEIREKREKIDKLVRKTV